MTFVIEFIKAVLNVLKTKPKLNTPMKVCICLNTKPVEEDFWEKLPLFLESC